MNRSTGAGLMAFSIVLIIVGAIMDFAISVTTEGFLRELMEGDDINVEKSLSFELFRRSLTDVEVITFDELYQRAIYIVRDVPDDGEERLPSTIHGAGGYLSGT